MAEARGVRILALSADLMFATQVRDTLARAGYRVEVVESQVQAVAGLQELRPQLLLVDIAAPGLSLADLVREAGAAGVPVLAFGRHTDKEGLAAALAAGCVAALPRSRLVTEMASLVARYAGTEQAAAS